MLILVIVLANGDDDSPWFVPLIFIWFFGFILLFVSISFCATCSNGNIRESRKYMCSKLTEEEKIVL